MNHIAHRDPVDPAGLRVSIRHVIGVEERLGEKQSFIRTREQRPSMIGGPEERDGRGSARDREMTGAGVVAEQRVAGGDHASKILQGEPFLGEIAHRRVFGGVAASVKIAKKFQFVGATEQDA